MTEKITKYIMENWTHEMLVANCVATMHHSKKLEILLEIKEKEIEEEEKNKPKPKKRLEYDNEICYCGHLKTEHSKHIIDEHGGACTKCDCVQYTWKAFIKYNEL